MNHLTNLYKHKCEQLQEQINNIKKMLSEVNAPPDGGLTPIQMPTEWDLVGPRSPNYGIPTGFPGSDQHGPPSPYDFSDAPQPPTGNDPVEWNNWLDRMWQWYINKYPYNMTSPNTNSGYWWKIWRDIQKLAPGGSEWNWESQPANPNGPPNIPFNPKPNNTPVIPIPRKPQVGDPTQPMSPLPDWAAPNDPESYPTWPYDRPYSRPRQKPPTLPNYGS
jgi:hypothetical protein